MKLYGLVCCSKANQADKLRLSSRESRDILDREKSLSPCILILKLYFGEDGKCTSVYDCSGAHLSIHHESGQMDLHFLVRFLTFATTAHVLRRSWIGLEPEFLFVHCLGSNCIALHCTALHCTAPHYIAEHCLGLTHCLLLFHRLVGQHVTVRYVPRAALEYAKSIILE